VSKFDFFVLDAGLDEQKFVLDEVFTPPQVELGDIGECGAELEGEQLRELGLE
jgi:hypothetical protein